MEKNIQMHPTLKAQNYYVNQQHTKQRLI